jgi:hypothetical protein
MPTIQVLVDGTAVEMNVTCVPAAQEVADYYGRRVRLFSKWTKTYLGDLAPQRQELES